MSRVRVTLLLVLGLLLWGAAPARALDPQLVAAGCPGAPDCTAPEDRTPLVVGWSRATTITLTGFDADTGINRMEHVLDGGPLTGVAYGATVNLGGDGSHTLATRAVDGAGNSSAWQEQTIQIDTTAPTDTTPAAAVGWTTSSSVNVVLSGTDATSGLARMEYKIGTGTVQSVASGDTVTVTGQGVVELQHRAVDVAGNPSAWQTDRIRIDTIAPTDTTVVPAGWSADAASVTLAGTDASSGVDVVRWRVPGGPVQTAAPGTTLSVTTPNTSTIETQVVDVAGNPSAWKPNLVRVDTSDPVDATSAPSGWQTSAPVSVTVTGSDAQAGIAAVEWMLDSPTVHHVDAGSTTASVTGDGEHLLQTRVIDNAGRRTAWRTSTVRVDTTDPTNNVVVPTGWSTGPVDVALDGADGGSGVARIEWSLDGGPVTNGVRNTVVRVNGNGVRSLRTTVVDVAGRSTTVTSTVRIDDTAPSDTTVVGSSTKYGSTGRIALTATDAVSGVARMEHKVDGVAASGPSGTLVDLGAPGPHVLQRRAVDTAGNASAWVTTTVVVDPTLNGDTTDPVDTTSPPAAWQTSSPVLVPVTGTDADTAVGAVQWRLDGGAVQTGAPGDRVSLSGDGVHRFDTRVRDLVNRFSAWAPRTVRIDATSPTDTTTDPTGWQAAATVTLEGTDATSGVDAMEWSVDNGATQRGPSGSTTASLPEGVHTVEHRAVDVAGNTSAYRTATVRVDNTLPVDTSPTTPTGWQTSSFSFAPTGTDARSGVAAVEFTLDNAPVATRPVLVEADGPHVLRTRVTDNAGNATAWRDQAVRVDRHAPTDTTPTAPSGWRTTAWTATPAADDGLGSGVALVEHTVGTGPVRTGALRVDAQGATTVSTRATDNVGHVSAWRKQVVRIDSVAPVASVSCAPAAAPTGYVCRAGARDATSGVAALRLRVGDGTWRTLPAAGGTVAVAAGAVVVEATDVAGLTARASTGPLAVRVPPAPAPVTVVAPTPSATPTPAPSATATPAPATRTRRVTVSRPGRGSKNILGSFVLSSTAEEDGSRAVADARPLALGAGRQRIALELRAGELVARRVKVVRLPKTGGYSPRLGVALSGVRKRMTATLTVSRRKGRRWVTVATATTHLKP